MESGAPFSQHAAVRLDTLDAMRGVAAMAVLFHHLAFPGFGRAYLAVDLFFLLSGYVMGHAYEARLNSGLGLRRFMRERLIRLYPLIFLGALLGYAAAVSNHAQVRLANVALVSQLLFLPGLARGPYIFMLNGLQWSLFFEIVANAAHAAWLKVVRTPVLAAGVAVAALVVLAAAAHYTRLSGGLSKQTFVVGLVRVVFSYGAGLAIYRIHKAGRLPRISAPWWLLVLAPLALIAVISQTRAPWWADAVMICVAFPLVLAAAVNAAVPRRWLPLAAFSGFISYPLYALQMPLFSAARHALIERGLPTSKPIWLAFAVAMVGLAWLVGRFYDAPVRAWMSRVIPRVRPSGALQPQASS